MSDEKLNLKMVIAELEQTKATVLPLLEGQPMLQLRTESTLNRLIGGFGQIDGIEPSERKATTELQPLKKFMGANIQEKKDHQVKKVNLDEVQLSRERGKEIIATFMDREDKELFEAVSEPELRVVAKLAGMNWVTSTKPQKLTVKFIADIKEAIAKKREVKKEQEDIKLREDRTEILKNLNFTYSEENKNWSLGDHAITDDELTVHEVKWDKFLDLVKNDK